jgi:hypothetical protein
MIGKGSISSESAQTDSVEISTAARTSRQLLAEFPPHIHLAFNGSDSFFSHGFSVSTN